MDTVQTNPAAAVSRRFILLLETLICKKKNVISRHSLNSVQSENKKKNPQGPHGSCCPALGTFVSMKQMCMSGNTALIVTRTLQHKHSWSSCCCSFLSVCWCSGWTDSQISPVFNTLTSRCLLWTARPLSAPEASTSFSSYSLVPAMFIQYAAEDEGLNKLQ